MALTQEDLQAINQLLTPIQQDIKNLKGDMEVVKSTVSHTATTIETLSEGQRDIRKGVVNQIANHERRLTEVEDQAHSHKN